MRLSNVEFQGKWIQLPSVTTAERNALGLTGLGYMLFNSDTHTVETFNGVSWGASSSGATGAQGSTGQLGTQGATGVTGVTGIQGAVGQTGLAGSTGSQGLTGLQGFTGFQGSTGAPGYTGVYGQTGTTGVTGAQGATGVASVTTNTTLTGSGTAGSPLGVSIPAVRNNPSAGTILDVQTNAVSKLKVTDTAITGTVPTSIITASGSSSLTITAPWPNVAAIVFNGGLTAAGSGSIGKASGGSDLIYVTNNQAVGVALQAGGSSVLTAASTAITASVPMAVTAKTLSVGTSRTSDSLAGTYDAVIELGANSALANKVVSASQTITRLTNGIYLDATGDKTISTNYGVLYEAASTSTQAGSGHYFYGTTTQGVGTASTYQTILSMNTTAVTASVPITLGSTNQAKLSCTNAGVIEVSAIGSPPQIELQSIGITSAALTAIDRVNGQWRPLAIGALSYSLKTSGAERIAITDTAITASVPIKTAANIVLQDTSSGYAGIWGQSVGTPSLTNYAFLSRNTGADTYMNGTLSVSIAVAGAYVLTSTTSAITASVPIAISSATSATTGLILKGAGSDMGIWNLGSNIGIAHNNDVIPGTTNAMRCGNPSYKWSEVWAVNGAIQTSDLTTKTDITEAPLGLSFILALKPIAYKFVVGGNKVTQVSKGIVKALVRTEKDGTEVFEDKEEFEEVVTEVPGKRQHFGFGAQDVEKLVNDAGVDFGGHVKYVDDTDGKEYQALRYNQFIAPMVKAMQEQQAIILDLKERVASLEARS